ncbi:MAG: GrpB family protein [Ruminococcaceae bacterium]|nr:GrpB family protein [Oscillospiraceae bacterium]
MQTKCITVEAYDPQWEQDFREIKDEIDQVLAGLHLGIEHVGSTSVPGLSAKPIIDVDVIIKNRAALPLVIERLSSIGYIYEGNLGIVDREAFGYKRMPHLKKHHLYVCPEDSRELRRHIIFREYLRSHPEAAAQYSKVKEDAAKLYPNDIEKYMQYKSSCIKYLYKLCGLE